MRGKLLHLREGFLNAAQNTKHLKMLISQSLAAFTTIFSALLKLKNVELPEKRRNIFDKTAEAFDLDKNVFESLLQVRENKKKLSKQDLHDLMEKYIYEIKKITQIVDQL